MVVAGFDGYYRHVNPAFLRILGYTEQEALARPLIDFIYPDDRPSVIQCTKDLATGTPLLSFECRHVRRDQSLRWLSWTAFPNVQSEVIYGIGRDVTVGKCAQQHLQAELYETDEMLQSIIESTPDCVLVWDRDGNYLYANEAAIAHVGTTSDRVVGRNIREGLAHVPDFLQRWLGRIERAFQQQQTFHVQDEGSVGQRYVYSESTLSPIYNDHGDMIAVSVVYRDLTDRKLAEREMQKRDAQVLAVQHILEHLLPDAAPQIAGFDIAGRTCAAELAAGDHFDYLTLPDASMGFVVSDVVGHGLGPALLAASTQTLIRVLSQSRCDIGQILTLANAYLADKIEKDRFITMFMGRLEATTNTLVHSSAGHPPGFVLGDDGTMKTRLPSMGLPLGIEPDTVFAAGDAVSLDAGDVVVLFTDGVTEAKSSGDDFFGYQRALDVVRAYRDSPANQIIDRTVAAVREFTGQQGLEDDVTIVVIKREQ
jgi:PAS domain S-box-containing protein